MVDAEDQMPERRLKKPTAKDWAPADNPINNFSKRLDRRFHARLQEKTSWGKNEVYAQFREALIDTLMEMV
jgi:hypothetical protein